MLVRVVLILEIDVGEVAAIAAARRVSKDICGRFFFTAQHGEPRKARLSSSRRTGTVVVAVAVVVEMSRVPSVMAVAVTTIRIVAAKGKHLWDAVQPHWSHLLFHVRVRLQMCVGRVCQ